MHPAVSPLPEPPQSDCEHDWPPMWETISGSRHRCGRGPCRVLRVNEDDVLTYYDQAGTKIGWEPVPDYMRTWREWWAPLLSGGAQDGPSQPGPRPADLTAIMRELHHYGAMMTEVAKVYDELTGGRISKPNTAAFHVLDASARREDEHIVHVLDLLAGRLEEAGHAAAARIARNMREDYGGEPDTTIPDSGIVFRELRREVRSGAQFRPLLADPPRWSPGTGPYCDDTLVIISGTSPVQVACRAADLPGGGEDPQRRDQVLLVLGELCRDRGWIADVADVGDQIITIVSDQHAAAAATVVTETLRAAGLGPVTLHDDADDAAAGLDGIHVIAGTWPVQLHIAAGEPAAADLARWLARQDGWRAEPSGDGWVAAIPAVPAG